MPKTLKGALLSIKRIVAAGRNKGCDFDAKGSDALEDIFCYDTRTPAKTWCPSCQASHIYDYITKVLKEVKDA